MFATWVSIVVGPAPTYYPTFTVQTRPGAVCTVTRLRLSDGRTRISPTFTANGSGVATLTWTGANLTHPNQYDMTATCTLSGNSASTTTQRITI
jgi:hypothetical protein